MAAATPVISIVGRSNSGKTTLLSSLLGQLKKRGYRVATIKHSDHDFDIDHPGTDTWCHYQAGADIVAVSTPAKMALIKKVATEIPLDSIIEQIDNVDLIITEGYKYGNKPKIEVHRAAIPGALLSRPEELLAVVTDEPLDAAVPCYDLHDVVGLANLIETKILTNSL